MINVGPKIRVGIFTIFSIFETESDSDEEFEGFHDDWIHDGFSPVNKREFQGIGGTSTIHPEETRSIQYFLYFWNDAM